MDNQYMQPQQQGGYNPPPSNPGQGLGIASMVLGILALVVPYVGIVMAIVGLVLGAVGKKKSKDVGMPSGMATAGIVCSIIALGWAILVVTLCASCLGSLGLMF
jgi:hypothetical protein